MLLGLGMDDDRGMRLGGSSRCRPTSTQWGMRKEKIAWLQQQWPDAPNDWEYEPQIMANRKDWEILCDFSRGELAVATTWDPIDLDPQEPPTPVIELLDRVDETTRDMILAKQFENVSYRQLAKRFGYDHPQQAKRAYESAVVVLKTELTVS